MTGREAPAAAGIFRSKTGSLRIFAFQQNHWASLCEVMGRPELINDPRCAEHNSRVANRGFVNAEITKWLMTLPGNEAAVEIMSEAHIPHAPVLSVEEAMAHPHFSNAERCEPFMIGFSASFRSRDFRCGSLLFPTSSSSTHLFSGNTIERC
jgi:crotonobetainyl-CoA:carnitine CoA-transferase CaiB-like acyl-CoA transferase